jgi:hypothetical protein
MRRLALAATLLVVLSSQVLAWSDAGHKIVASIAFRQLTPDGQAKVVAILRNHPRFVEDFAGQVPPDTPDEGKNEWFFQQASVWPDIARGFRGDDAKYNHGTWHYINLPSFLDDTEEQALAGKLTVNISLDPPSNPEEKINAIQTIRLSRAMLADPGVANREKAIMLTWLFHVVGDIHQPLHSTAMFSRRLFPEGDRGGNQIPTVQRNNLHSLWDGFPGGKADLAEARNGALKLLADADLAALGRSSAKQLGEEVWLNESHDLCGSMVYDAEVLAYLRDRELADEKLEPLKLSEDYLRAGGRVCSRRVVQAGYRLGAILKSIVE